MKIFSNDVELDFPKWITVEDSTVNFKTNTIQINDRPGEVLSGVGSYSARVFSCSGNMPTDNWAIVEKERSRLTDLLVDKELQVYRDDEDKIFYKCILDGNIKIKYYNGFNLSKVFGISFTLKAIEPFGYGDKKEIEVTGGMQTISIDNKGNSLTLPTFEIADVDNLDGILFECHSSVLEVENIEVNAGEKIIYKNNLLYAGEDDITNKITDESFIKPIYFNRGLNELKINIITGKIKIIFFERYK